MLGDSFVIGGSLVGHSSFLTIPCCRSSVSVARWGWSSVGSAALRIRVRRSPRRSLPAFRPVDLLDELTVHLLVFVRQRIRVGVELDDDVPACPVFGSRRSMIIISAMSFSCLVFGVLCLVCGVRSRRELSPGSDIQNTKHQTLNTQIGVFFLRGLLLTLVERGIRIGQRGGGPGPSSELHFRPRRTDIPSDTVPACLR